MQESTQQQKEEGRHLLRRQAEVGGYWADAGGRKILQKWQDKLNLERGRHYEDKMKQEEGRFYRRSTCRRSTISRKEDNEAATEGRRRREHFGNTVAGEGFNFCLVLHFGRRGGK